SLAVFVKAGYAVAQSGYSAGGWAVEQAVVDTEVLRQYFAEKYGKPTETYVSGDSMGGLLTVLMIEKYPDTYDAGLALCGVIGAAPSFMQRAFDERVVFDYYFPGLLPSPAKVPASYEMSETLTRKVLHALNAKPAAAAAVRSYTEVHSNRELADGIVFLTYILKDLEQRSGGNPFDNRNTIYTRLPASDTVNDRIARYEADQGALTYLQQFYTPTGKLTRPVLAVHTTYDPLVSPAIPSDYSLVAREAGSGQFFVQQYVKHGGHCNIKPAEVEHGFTELVTWKKNGKAPKSGWLRIEQAPAAHQRPAKKAIKKPAKKN
ncbi:MAG: alpha/beta hydrolase, partial [Candidatus Koribacter versatilis]|nr:alpha/beta hydrolase [Candidatus Koribacter versatilis]